MQSNNPVFRRSEQFNGHGAANAYGNQTYPGNGQPRGYGQAPQSGYGRPRHWGTGTPAAPEVDRRADDHRLGRAEDRHLAGRGRPRRGRDLVLDR